MTAHPTGQCLLSKNLTYTGLLEKKEHRHDIVNVCPSKKRGNNNNILDMGACIGDWGPFSKNTCHKYLGVGSTARGDELPGRCGDELCESQSRGCSCAGAAQSNTPLTQAPQPGLARDHITQPQHPCKAASPSPERRGQATKHTTDTPHTHTRTRNTRHRHHHCRHQHRRHKHTKHTKARTPPASQTHTTREAPPPTPKETNNPQSGMARNPPPTPTMNPPKETPVTAPKTLRQEGQGAVPTPQTPLGQAGQPTSSATHQALCQEWRGPTPSTRQRPTTPRPTRRTIDCSTLNKEHHQQPLQPERHLQHRRQW